MKYLIYSAAVVCVGLRYNNYCASAIDTTTTTTVVLNQLTTTTADVVTPSDGDLDIPLQLVVSDKNDDHQASSCMTIDEYGNTIPDPDCTTTTTTTTTNNDDDNDEVVVAVPNTNDPYSDPIPTMKKEYTNEELRLGADIGVIQAIDIHREDEIIQVIQSSREYVLKVTRQESKHYNNNNNNNIPECRNTNEHCTFWSLEGECTKNSHYMSLYCAPVCRTCHILWELPSESLPNELQEQLLHDHDGEEDDKYSEEEDDDKEEEVEEEMDEATRALNLKRGSDLGVPQLIEDSERGAQILEAIIKTRTYINDVVNVDEKYEKVRGLCRNTNESCTYWSLTGECEANPGFMLIHCAPACQTCDQVHVDTRCLMSDDILTTTIFPKKDMLNEFYERIIHDPYYQSQYNVTVLSRPTYADGDSADNTNLTYAVTGLWVIQFDNIVNETEAQRLIDLGKQEGYERSADVGEAKPDGTFDSSVNDGRTSTNAWCMDECNNDTATLNLHDRIENITNITRQNYENLQILQYYEHQYYKEHNDFIEYQVDRPCGSRILTFYIYLNTIPEEGGGGTNFPKVNLTVTPKLGRAILWPSILNDAPDEMDPLSNHQALPVLNGYVKYGVNAWIHQRDFQKANHIGCA